tara:strand:- start:4028 stop:4231 length:204 start_codon:yes stop_codon:yes gene_type:complete
MCFGPSRAEKQAAVTQRMEADEAQRREAEKRAMQKREDIQEAILKRQGRTRRSLFSAGRGGFLGRFD